MKSCEAARLATQARSCTVDVPVLNGQIPLECLNPATDTRSCAPIGNPAHGNPANGTPANGTPAHSGERV